MGNQGLDGAELMKPDFTTLIRNFYIFYLQKYLNNQY